MTDDPLAEIAALRERLARLEAMARSEGPGPRPATLTEDRDPRGVRRFTMTCEHGSTVRVGIVAGYGASSYGEAAARDALAARHARDHPSCRCISVSLTRPAG